MAGRARRWTFLLGGSYLAGLLAVAAALLMPGGYQGAGPVAPPPARSDEPSAGDRGLPASAPRPAGTPDAAAPAGTPLLAVVVDDFGYDPAGDEEWLRLPGRATFAVIPFGPSSRRVARAARERGFAVLLHVPMEPEAPAPDRTEGVRLRRGMSREEMEGLFARMLADVPGATGASNHMGSAFTADGPSMKEYASLLARRGLYLLDSVTTPRSAALPAARAAGIPAARRDVIVEARAVPEEMRERWDRAVALARKNGSAVFVCHADEETRRFLLQSLPALPSQGIRPVTTDELLARRGG